MSSSKVVVTRRTTTNRRPLSFALHTDYVKSTPGILKAVETELLYHCVAFIFYLCGSLNVLILVASHNETDYWRNNYGFEGKITAAVLGGICLGLTITYGTPVWLLLGPAYGLFLTTASATFFGAAVTFLSYLLSSHTFRAIRTTILETVQNIIASILYTGASIFLLIRTSFILWPLYLVTPYFQAYPAMMAVSVFGLVAALVHAVDAVCAQRAFKQRG
ncbi:protein singles bar-like isoform X2 [Tachypleus tridentatus]|uniref:protein singles bar-like isoform X2 n=1 Tax=Tachypleus tridentatus TaxID=6853 RepID=UPI003FD52728